MKSIVRTNVRYRKDGCVITETICDGDVYSIVEEYFDDDGYLIYSRTLDFDPKKLMKMHGEKKHENKKLEKNRKRV